MTLDVRIEAAIDRVEQVARDANGERWSQYGSKPYEVYVDEDWGDQDAPYIAVPETEADGEHIALNDPAAVLRRCAADRRVLARHQQYTIPAGYDGAGMPNCNRCNGYEWPCDEIRDLADRYSVEVGDPS